MKHVFQAVFLSFFSILLSTDGSIAQTVLPIVGDPSLFCINIPGGQNSIVRAGNSSFTNVNIGKELKKLKNKIKSNKELLKDLRKELSSVPKTDKFATKRARLQNTINKLVNENNAKNAIQSSINKCRNNLPLQPEFTKIVLVDVVNAIGERVIATIGIRRRLDFTCGKGCTGFVAGGSWCITYTSSGEIPYGAPSGQEVQGLFYDSDRMFDSLHPNAQKKIVADNEIWTPLFQARNPSNPTDATNQVVARTGDLSITSRPIAGRPCGT